MRVFKEVMVFMWTKCEAKVVVPTRVWFGDNRSVVATTVTKEGKLEETKEMFYWEMIYDNTKVFKIILVH